MIPMEVTPAHEPLTETAAVAETVRRTGAVGGSLRIEGAGTWLDAGRPVHGLERLSLGSLRGIVDYVPGDLTLTARAGTTLAELARVTRAEGQWLSLQPWGGDQGTLGATIATASAGPLAHAFGAPRDVVLGVEVVTGLGTVVRGGGRVVKNVAGYDLTRLMTGAWGTLGVITEISVRLRGMPAVDETAVLSLPRGNVSALEQLLGGLRTAPIAPIALELVSEALARHLAIGPGTMLLARLAGNEDTVAAQRSAFAALGDVVRVDGDVWHRLRTWEPTGSAMARVSRAPADLARTWQAAIQLGDGDAALAHATVGRGVVRCAAAASRLDAAQLASLRNAGCTVIFERLPETSWAALALPTACDHLSQGLRRVFDPGRVLNPGLLGASAL